MSSTRFSVNPDTFLRLLIGRRCRAHLVWLALLALAGVFAAGNAYAAPMCPVPDPNPPANAMGVVNTYFAGTGSLNSGATQLTLGTRHAGSAAGDIQAGDLLLVIQMQDAEINSSNNANYGSGQGDGMGSTSMGNAGLHEFVVATSAGGAGSVVTFSPAVSNTYVQSPADSNRGQRSYQVIRVPRYRSVTVAGVEAPAWNGSSGGVVAIDASGTLTLGEGTVEGIAGRAVFVAGRGFRGAAGYQGSRASNDTHWRLADGNSASTTGHGGKGEGIAGTPRYLARKTNGFGAAVTSTAHLERLNNGVQGYPQGDRARGAPGNAGGGGTDGTYSPGTAANIRNAGGGGGGNHAPGGLGGRPWDSPLNDTNGRGGAGYADRIGFSRVILGGGGGSGGTNDGTDDRNTYVNNGIGCGTSAGSANGGSWGSGICSSGGSGGGIVILRARSIVGDGIIDVRGAHGYNVRNDAAGGGGAGGSVVLHTIEGGHAKVDARGGDGGNAWAGHNVGLSERHGPGGGGGGGFVVFAPASMQVEVDASGGAPGISTNGPDDTYGSYGHHGGIATFMLPDTPGVPPGAVCEPDLRLSKSNGSDVLLTSGSTTYSLVVSNQSVAPSSGLVTVVDVLPAQLGVADGPVPVGGPQGNDWNCSAASNVLTCTSSAVIAAGGSSTFAFTADVTASSGNAIINRARVGGGGDPNKPTPTAANTGHCSGDNVEPGCAVDVDIVEAPLLALRKANAGTLLAGGSGSYTLTLENIGSAPTVGAIRIVDALPAGMSFLSGFSTTGGFICSHASGVIECDSNASLPVGGTANIQFNVTVAADAASSLTNRAVVGGGGDPVKPALPVEAQARACAAPVPPADQASSNLSGCASVTDPVRRVLLTLEKTDYQNAMPINGQTTYHFTVRNSGDADSVGTIHFRDELPAPMTWSNPLVTAGDNGPEWTCVREDADSVTCQSNTVIPAGGSSRFSLLANVNGAVTNVFYVNKARLGGGGDPALLPGLPAAGEVTSGCVSINDAPGCALDINVAVAQPRIRLEKTHADPQARNPGDTVAFNLVVGNSGGSASSGSIRVVDVIPAGLVYAGPATFSSGGFSCTHSAAPAPGYLTCNRTTALAAGATATISYSVTVDSDAANPLVNRAQVGGGGDSGLLPVDGVTPASVSECSGDMTPNPGCAIDPIPLNADLRISKQQRAGSSGPFQDLPLTLLHGDVIQFQIVISNNGPSHVANAVFSDVVPSQFSGLSIVSADGSSAPECTLGAYQLSGNTLSGSIAMLEPGGSCTLILQANAGVIGQGIVNTAMVVVPAGVVDTDASNNGASTSTDIAARTPALSILKTSTDTFLVPGGAVEYVVDVANTGNVPLANVQVSDPVPASLSGFSWTCSAAGGVSCPATSGSGALNATIPSLPVGGSLSWTIQASVAIDASGSLTNTASASATEICTLPLPCTSEVTLPLTQLPGVAKLFSPDAIHVGEISTLTITLTNPNTAAAVLTADLVDTLPTGVTLASAPTTSCTGTAIGTVGGSSITLPAGASIPGGAPGTCTITAQVTSATPGTLTNLIAAGGLVTDLGANPDLAEADLEVLPTPAVSISKSANPADGSHVSVGQVITYTLTVHVADAATLSDVVLDDVLGTGLILLPASLPADCSATLSGVSCTLPAGAAPAGSPYTFQYQAQVNVGATGTLENSVTATGGSHPGEVPECVAADACATEHPVALPGLALVKSVISTGPYVLGSPISYSFNVANTGNVNLTGVSVNDPLLGGTVACTPSALPPAQVATCGPVNYTVQPADADAGQVTNTAIATGTAPDGTLVSDTDAVITPIDQNPSLTLAKSVTSAGPYSAGDTIAYSLVATNTGDVTLADVSISDTGATLGSCTPNQPASLAPGASLSCDATYQVQPTDVEAGEYINTASVSGTAPDNGPVSDSDTVSTPVAQAPALSLVKSVTSTGPYSAGDVIGYSLVATNTGDVTLTDVSISDTGATLGTCTPAQPATLAPNATLTCSASYEVQPADVEAGEYINAASVVGTAPGGTPVEDTDAVITPIDQNPGLTLAKSVTSTGPYSAGDVISYSLVATNTGDVTLADVSISDTGATLGSCTPNQPASLAPGASLSCDATYQVQPADVEAGEYTNTASASGSAPDNSSVSDSDSVSTPIAQEPALTLVKSVTSTGPYSAGDTITYSLVATNTGDVTLANVSISDTGATLGSCTPNQPASLAPGASLSCDATYQVQPADVEAGEYTNTASASGSAPDNSSVSDSDSVSTPIAQEPVLTLVKTVTSTGPYSAGDVISYSLVATNTGDVSLTNVLISDTGAALGSCTPNQPATLAPNATLTCSASYEVQPGDVEAGEYTNAASATGAAPDGTLVSDTDAVVTPIDQNPGLTLAKSVTSTGPYSAGDVITYSLVATNTGDVTLANVAIADTGATLGGCTPNQPATLAPGVSLSCDATYAVQPADVEAGEYTNTATATGTTPEGGTVDGQDSTTTPVMQHPGLELVKAITSSGPYGEGDTINYSFTLTNTGDVTLTDVEILDDLPDLGALSYQWPGEPGRLAPGQTVVATAVYVVTATDVAEGSVLNIATAAGTPPVLDPQDPPAPIEAPPSQVETPVEAGVLVISKTGPSVAGAGEEIVFTILVSNTGQVPLANVVVSDQTPPGLEFVGNSGDCSDPFPCFLGTLAAGDSRVIDVTLRLPHWYTGPNPIVNTATASSTSTPEESSSTATVPVRLLSPHLIPVASWPTLLLLGLAMLAMGWQARRLRC